MKLLFSFHCQRALYEGLPLTWRGMLDVKVCKGWTCESRRTLLACGGFLRRRAMHNNDGLNVSLCCLAGWVAGGQRVIPPSHFHKCYLVTMERKWSYLAMIKGSPYGRNIRPGLGCSHCRCSTFLDCRTHCIKAFWPHGETSQVVQHFHSFRCSPLNSFNNSRNMAKKMVHLVTRPCSHRV